MPQAADWIATREGPYQALGCGDAWCVLDAQGRLAWEPRSGRSPLTDKDTAIKVAGFWNEQIAH